MPQVVDDIAILVPGHCDGGAKLVDQPQTTDVEAKRGDIIVVLINSWEQVAKNINDLR